MNLVEFFTTLFNDKAAAGRFADSPHLVFEEYGIEPETLSYEELNEAAILACSGPVSQGATVNTGGATATVVTAPAPTAPPIAVTPPPPPQPAPSTPPAQAATDIVNYYVTEVHEHVTTYDNDYYEDRSVTNNVIAEDGSYVDIDQTIASGDEAIAIGEDAEVNAPVNSGDNAVVADGDINAPVNTGVNNGIIAEDSDIDDTIVGDGNTQVNDSEQVAIGDHNVQADDQSQAAGGDLTDNDQDIDITDSTVNNANVGSDHSTAEQDNSVDLDLDVDLNSNNHVEVEQYEEPVYEEAVYEVPEYESNPAVTTTVEDLQPSEPEPSDDPADV